MHALGWYVLATSPSGRSVATLGPYVTRTIAEQRAREACLESYRVLKAAVDAPDASRDWPSIGRVSVPLPSGE